MKTLSDLSKNLDVINKNFHNNINNLAKIVAKTIHNDLLNKTPVDTSNALSNWIVSAGVLTLEEIDPFYIGIKGSTQLLSIRAASIVADIEINNKKPMEPIFISNSVPYIKDLDSGASKQEPAGFVNRAVELGRLSLHKKRVLSKWKILNTKPTKLPNITAEIIRVGG